MYLQSRGGERKTRSASLKTVIGGFYSFLVILAMFSLGMLTTYRAVKSVETASLESQRALASYDCKNLDSWIDMGLDTIQSRLARAASERGVVKAVAERDAGPLAYSAKQLRSEYHSIVSLGFAASQGQPIASNPWDSDIDAGSILHSQLNREPVWIRRDQKRDLICYLIIPVGGSEPDSAMGLLWAQVSLVSLIRDFCLLNGSNSRFSMVIDGKGRYVWHHDSGKIGKKMEKAEEETGLTGHRSTVASISEAGGKKRHLVSSYSPKWNWYYVITGSKNTASRLIEELKFWFIAWALIIGLAAIILGFRLADWAVSPSRALTDAARRIARSDFTVRVPETGTKEFSILSRAFNEMVLTIAEQRREIQARYVELETKNIQLERAYKDSKSKSELLQKQQNELLSRNVDIARKNEEIRDQNDRLALLNLELRESNNQLQNLVEELKEKDYALDRLMMSEAAQASAIIEGTADLIVVTNMDGVISLANPAAAEFFGKGADALEGLHCSQVLSCRDSDGKPLCGSKGTCPLETATLHHGDRYRELKVTSVTKGVVDVGVRWSLVRDSTTGIDERAVCILRDISRQKEVERAKSDFVSSVSHELRTPLTSMKGFTYLLLRDDIDLPQDEKREYISIIDEQIERLSRMIQDLLDVSKIEAGVPIEIRPGPVKARCVVGKILSHMEKGYPNLRYKSSVPEGLMVSADEDKLIQILMNLISNASKFSPGGGDVTVEVSEDGPMAVFRVRDSGIGIPQDNLERIFDRFFRGEYVKGKVGGTGLGLCITKALVEAHGGKIWAESEGQGKGSVFSFTLPVGGVAQAVRRVV